MFFTVELLWRKSGKLKAQIIFAIFMTCLMAALELLSIVAVAPIVGSIINDKEFETSLTSILPVSFTGYFWFSLFVVAGIFRLTYLYVQYWFCHRLAHEVSMTIYDRVMHASFESLPERGGGDTVAKLSLKITQLNNLIMIPISNILYGLVILTFVIFGLIFFASPVFFVPLLFLGLVYLTIYFLVQSFLNRQGALMALTQNKLFALCAQIFNIRRNIMLDNSFGSFTNVFSDLDKTYRLALSNMNFLSVAPKQIVELVVISSLFIFLGSFLDEGFDPRSNIPEFAALVYGFQKLLPIVQGLFRGVSSLRSGGAINNEVSLLANIRQDENTYLHNAKINKEELKTISWADLKFEIPREGKELIQFPDGQIGVQQKAIILGPSGTGKSTFLNILMGFIKPSSGKLFVNGRQITPSDTAALRVKSGLVGQETYVRGDSIREAVEIKIGKFRHRLREIKHMSMVMNLTDAANFENWLETELVSGGANLSIGQRQRLAIMLELLGDRDILFLDEFTSALDNENARAVCDLILSSDKTIIAITHSTMVSEFFEKVFVFE